MPMKWTMTAAISLSLMGCQAVTGSLAGYDGLQQKLLWHYRTHAVEENGNCRMPEIRGITKTDVIEDSADQLILQLRYRYLDTVFQNEKRPTIIANCEGFNSREFKVAKANGKLTVTDMSGAVR